MSDVGLVRAPFPRYWLSAFVADFGDGVRMAALPLLAVHVTATPAAIAAVTALQGLPWLVVGVGVGAIVDRRDLRRTMVGIDTVRVVTIVALAIAVAGHAVSLPLIYVVALVEGIGSMVRDTAASTAVPRIVKDDDLERANGRMVAGGIVGQELAGPAVGGWLFGVAAVLPFAVNAGSLGIAMLLLLTLPGVFAPLPRARSRAGVVRSTLADVREGLGWLWRDRPIRNLVVAVGVVAAADGAYFAILVLYVTRILHEGASVYGLLLAVGAVGGVAAGTAVAWFARRIGTTRTLVAAVVTMAASQLLLGLTSEAVMAAVALALSSAAFAAFNATSSSVRQRRAPAAILARINSAYLTVGRGAEAAGALLGGLLAGVAGIRTPILAGVIPLLATAALIMAPRDRATHRH